MAKLTIEAYGREFEHGEINVIKKDGVEKTVEISIKMVISDDVSELKEELEEIIAKYAI